MGHTIGCSVPGDGVFITPDGAWLREGSEEFFVALGDPDPDYDAALFAVRNLGFIFVRVVAAALVEITLHPRNVAPAALSEAQKWLRSFRSHSFQINHLKDRGTSEVLATPAQAICRLFELCALETTEEASCLEHFVLGDTTAWQSGFASAVH